MIFANLKSAVEENDPDARREMSEAGLIVGFKDADDLAARIDAFKKEFGLRTTLTEIGGTEDDIRTIARESFDNRNMRASAAEPTLEEVEALYRKLL